MPTVSDREVLGLKAQTRGLRIVQARKDSDKSGCICRGCGYMLPFMNGTRKGGPGNGKTKLLMMPLIVRTESPPP